VVWQVRSLELRQDSKYEYAKSPDAARIKDNWKHIVENWQRQNRGYLQAKAGDVQDASLNETSTVSPLSRYRGPENQLYRVEVHRGGTVGAQSNNKDAPTFKWSRDNGSNAFRILDLAGSVVTVQNLGRNAGSGIAVGDWVEITDDHSVLQGRVQPLLQVADVKRATMRVTVNGEVDSSVGGNQDLHPTLRRWDHKAADPRRGGSDLRDGALVIKEGEGDRFWLTLEKGIQVHFQPSDPGNVYRAGDYWLIPARTATGDVVWPRSGNKPRALPPHGVEHHYAPLAVLAFNEHNLLQTQVQCRQKFGLPLSY
jgi:hypothetical protein